MNKTLSYIIAVMGLLVMIVGCSSDSSNGAIERAADLSGVANFVIAADAEGKINVFGLNAQGQVVNRFSETVNGDGTPVTAPIETFALTAAGGGNLTGVGELHYDGHNNQVVAVIRNGMDADNNGGVISFDPHEAIVNGNLTVKHQTVLASSKSENASGDPIPTRLVHSYMDPDGDHLWVNNDGPGGGLDAGEPDSAFKVVLKDLSYHETLVGNGHKKSAFMAPTPEHPELPQLFITHNGRDASISIVDNDPANVDEDGSAPVLHTATREGEGFHGMASSGVNGRIYVGSTDESAPVALAVIDATGTVVDGQMVVADDPSLDIPTGMGFFDAEPLNEIPAAGYVKTAHDGTRVYTYGWTDDNGTGRGYLSAVDTSDFGADAVSGVIEVGNVDASSIDIVEYADGDTEVKKMFIPARVNSCFNDDRPESAAQQAANDSANRIAVVYLDANGDIDTAAGPNENGVDMITVGEAPCHRNGEAAHDGSVVVYPNGCADGGPRGVEVCSVNTVNIINTRTHSVTTVNTAGVSPGQIKILEAAAVLNPQGDASHDDEHTH